MSGENESDRLRRLEARIAAAKAAKETGSHNEAHYAQANLAWRMVTELVAGIAIGFAIGLGIDTLLGTAPWAMVVFLGFGTAAGIKVMMRTAAEVRARAPETDPAADAETGGADETPAQTGADETSAGTTGNGRPGADETREG